MVDTIRSGDFQARHLLLALDAGEPYRIARALAMEAGSWRPAAGQPPERAVRAARRGDALAERIDHPHAIGWPQLAAGVAAFELGRWAEARRRAGGAERIFRERCIGVAWETTTAQLFR